MRRRRAAWAVLSLTSLLLFAALAYLSAGALELERKKLETDRQAELGERCRLALWRLDGLLAPIVANENAQPYFVYLPYYPAGRAYGEMFDPPRPGERLLASPLAQQPGEFSTAHFQISPEGKWIDVAAGDKESACPLEAAKRLPSEFHDRDALLAGLPPIDLDPSGRRFDSSGNWLVSEPQNQAQSDDNDYEQRSYNSAVNLRSAQTAIQQAYRQNEPAPKVPEARKNREKKISEGMMSALWAGEELALARRVELDDKTWVQVCVLDWEKLREKLQKEIADLLPEARLLPQDSAAAPGPARLLATLPVRLEPGDVPQSDPVSSPLTAALAAAWFCAALAALSGALLLRGALDLGERRAAFVSAVSHELRTPLTTFRMYSEMLAGGMAPEARRQEYLQTLCRESERLSGLIENVLAYSRLEQGGRGRKAEATEIAALLAAAEPRLQERASGARMTLELVAPPVGRRALADPQAVERILFNLVDNACKYAAGAADRRITITEEYGAILVRDRGPGVPERLRSRLFTPFCKSDRDVADTAPGVGLGLALCRRLAAEMGGSLELLPSDTGACFSLRLPRA